MVKPYGLDIQFQGTSAGRSSTNGATCLPWVAHPHWRTTGSWRLREGAAAAVAALEQHTALALSSCRRAVSETRTDQSAGHANPWDVALVQL